VSVVRFSFGITERGEMKLVSALGTLAFNVFLLFAIPSLIVAFWGLVFVAGVFSTVFDFKSMK
jgi:ABC-type phosphate transport system permease subunit